MKQLTLKTDIINELKNHDFTTYEHSVRVARLLYRFGETLALTENRLNELFKLGLYHDIGKLRIDPQILNKKEKLTEREYIQLQKHTIYGEEILRQQGYSKRFLQDIRSHHENFDGSGYPDGLSSNEISLYALMLRIVDSYDAMVNVRSYKKVSSNLHAISELHSLKGRWYHPQLVEIFSETIIKESINK
ncbi:HD-GYP domain-containing protein [Oceanobacillus luteolus]|uniref:HD-GYP domain-containing protein n=1 Tax=Oceanobacillus luteolus TaxID=1274358 RepID=A0ABW4HTE7_9BACI